MSETVDPKAEARRKITDATITIVRLLNERADAALEVGQAKVQEGAAQVRDLNREGMVIDLACQASEGPLPDRAIAQIMQVIMNVTSELQADRFGLPLGVSLEEGPGFGAQVAVSD